MRICGLQAQRQRGCWQPVLQCKIFRIVGDQREAVSRGRDGAAATHGRAMLAVAESIAVVAIFESVTFDAAGVQERKRCTASSSTEVHTLLMIGDFGSHGTLTRGPLHFVHSLSPGFPRALLPTCFWRRLGEGL